MRRISCGRDDSKKKREGPESAGHKDDSESFTEREFLSAAPYLFLIAQECVKL